MAAQIRFLQQQGIDLASAVAAGGLLANVGNIAAQVILFVVALALSPTTIHTGDIPTSTAIVEVVLIVVVVAVIGGRAHLRRAELRNVVMPPVKSAATTIWEALRSPRRVAELFGGNIVNAFMYAAVMLTRASSRSAAASTTGRCSRSTSSSARSRRSSRSRAAAPRSTRSACRARSPRSGIPTEIAVAAVLANQLVASFIPAVPGWFATKDLMNHDYL